MTKERRLGRGLEALLGRSLDAPADGPGGPHPVAAEAAATVAAGEALHRLDVHQVDSNPFQPRRDFARQDMPLAASLTRRTAFYSRSSFASRTIAISWVSGERRLRAAIAQA